MCACMYVCVLLYEFTCAYDHCYLCIRMSYHLRKYRQKMDLLYGILRAKPEVFCKMIYFLCISPKGDINNTCPC